MFEIPIDELLGSFYLTFVHPEDRKRVHQQYYSQLKHSVKSTYSEFRYQSKNNKTGWLSFYVNPAIQEGKIVGLTGVAQDITERKQFQEALFKSEERLRLSLSAANQGLYDLNVQTGEAIVNDEYASMLGYDPKTFRESNENWIERLHPDDRESTAKAYLDYIEGKTSEYRVEFRQGTKNNEWKWILSLGKIIEYDAAGKPLGHAWNTHGYDRTKKIDIRAN